MNEANKTAKIVFNSGVAKRLLEAGCVITGLKQDRENPDKTLFVFKKDAHFDEAFAKINEELKIAKAQAAAE